MHIVVWNGFTGKLMPYHGDEDQACAQAQGFLEEIEERKDSNNPCPSVIYFYAKIDYVEVEVDV